jgi:hypothetical protein
MERMMEFKITEAEAREMARFEEEVGCDLIVGTDWGIHLDKLIELALIRAADPSGIRGIIVHTISAEAKDFYVALGFDPSPLEPMTLMIPLNDLRACQVEAM